MFQRILAQSHVVFVWIRAFNVHYLPVERVSIQLLLLSSASIIIVVVYKLGLNELIQPMRFLGRTDGITIYVTAMQSVREKHK